MRLGSYVGATPIKIRLKTQSATEILARKFRLKDCEDYKQAFLVSERQQIKEMVYKEQILKRKENEKNRTSIKGSDEIKVMYTKIDGLIPRKFVNRLSQREKIRNRMPSRNKII